MSDVPARIADDVVRWRRRIHRHPELGFAEIETSGLVEAELRRAGLEVRRVAGTGLCTTLTGASPGLVVALRADMDALPIAEQTELPFASEIPGAMHACGHDAHTAMLLGAAVWLASERSELHGSIKFFFQPAEEGPGGAKPMIDAGVMADPAVDAVAMIHVWPTLSAGSIGINSGPATASCDDFDIVVRGTGGHGGYPHAAIDTIPIAAEIVGALQRIASREVDPLDAVVVSIGTIEGGYRRNVIADETRLSGTVRTLDERVRATMPERIERIVAGICAAHRARHEVDFTTGYPSVFNDPSLASHIRDVARRVAGSDRVVDLPRPTMGAEDFSYFAQAAPGCMIRLGSASPSDQRPASLHSPHFLLDESTLPVGTALLRALAHDLPRNGHAWRRRSA
ncbi:MAG TPA: amidohydrolase [Candidatus Eremiobacteraceae bacterium]|nr:amidohydrolase [Candidatus Eremiobacteraceae bacterium]